MFSYQLLAVVLQCFHTYSIVCLLWCKSVEELLLCCILPLGQFGFTQAKYQGNKNVSTKAVWKLSFRTLVRNVACRESRVCFSSRIAVQNGPGLFQNMQFPAVGSHQGWITLIHLNELYQSSFLTLSIQPLQQGLGPVVLVYT